MVKIVYPSGYAIAFSNLKELESHVRACFEPEEAASGVDFHYGERDENGVIKGRAIAFNKYSIETYSDFTVSEL